MYGYNLGIRFEAIASQHPDRTAIILESGERLSYRELNSRGNAMARLLLERGVGRHDVVAIAGEKCAQAYSLMLACLKIGAIYSIVDPESPPERLRRILHTARPRLLFTGGEMGERIGPFLEELETATARFNDDVVRSAGSSGETGNLPCAREVTGADPAYIMFTSGSTGFPKGAVMTHGNVLNLIDWSVETFSLTPDDVLTNVNPLYFDNSVFDFYSSLFSGAALAAFSKETVTRPDMLLAKIDEFGCTSWFSVPTLLIFLDTMKALGTHRLKSVKRIIFGGEGYPKAKLKRLFDAFGERCEIINVYGPTECTCICSSYRVSAEDFADMAGFPPLGRMSDNFSFLILNEENGKALADEAGELCLLGPNVGKGYYNDLQRTAESFVQNPHNPYYSEVMYRTGDLVRLSSADGKIHILGRKDHQIKHMGYRIELEEIESALNSLPYVSHGAAVHGSPRGLSQIIAILATRRQVSEQEIRGDLRRILPGYMLPSSVHFVEELPKNPNGKVDRIALRDAYLKD